MRFAFRCHGTDLWGNFRIQVQLTPTKIFGILWSVPFAFFIFFIWYLFIRWTYISFWFIFTDTFWMNRWQYCSMRGKISCNERKGTRVNELRIQMIFCYFLCHRARHVKSICNGITICLKITAGNNFSNNQGGQSVYVKKIIQKEQCGACYANWQC